MTAARAAQPTNDRTPRRRRAVPGRAGFAVIALVIALVGAIVGAMAVAGCSREADVARVKTSSSADATAEPCRLKGVEIAIRCGTIRVAENRDASGTTAGTDAAAGRTIPIRFAVIPAQSRKAEPDAIFVFAGGPGQAATDVAAQVYPLFAKLNRERDVVLIDQRGTGGSHPLSCAPEMSAQTLADAFDASKLEDAVGACATRLSADADLTRYTTSIAMQDIDAVREHLGYPRIDLWGASYGTRAALEYLRQHPDRVRTMTLDGVAPAWVKLPMSFGVDTGAAVADLLDACAKDAACAARFPTLGADLATLMGELGRRPIETDVVHPLTGRKQHAVVTAAGFASLLRAPLYTGLTASLVPVAVEQASQGNFDALAALSVTVSNGLEDKLALGMHLSVLCSEDVPAITGADVAAAKVDAAKGGVDGRPNPFALVFYDQYRRLCARWPRGTVPTAYFASLQGSPGASVPTLLLSGGIDPATPPVHAEALARTMTQVKQVVAQHVGHGVSLQGCAPDLIERFVRDADVRSIDAHCLDAIPRPPFVVPIIEARRGPDTTRVP